MKKLMNFRPIVFLCLSAIVGIISLKQILYSSVIVGVVIITIFALCIALFCLLTNRRYIRRTLLFSAIFVMAFCMFGGLFTLQVKNYENADLGGAVLRVEAKVISSKETEYGVMLETSEVYVDGMYKGELGYQLAVHVYGESEFTVGDVIVFTAPIKDKTIIYNERFSASSIASGIKYFAGVEKSAITIIGNRANLFESINNQIQQTLKEGLSSDTYSVAYAMLCGNSDYVDEEVISTYRNTGVAHIFAVSGLHIGFIAMAMSLILKRICQKEWLKALITIPLLIFYSGICGFTASSVRAVIMVSTSLIVNAVAKRYEMLNSIGFSALLILAFSPVQLFCVGFQLSFGVVTGIALFSNSIARVFKFLPRKFSMTLGTMLAAQLTSIPIVLANFSQASIISVIANILFIPIAEFIFISLIIVLILALIFSPILLYVHNFIFQGVNYFIGFLDQSFFIFGGFSLGIFAIAYYLSLFICSDYVNLRIISKTILSLVMVVICVLGTLFSNLYYYSKVRVTVSGGSAFSTTLIQSPQEDFFVISTGTGNFSTSKINTMFNNQEQEVDVVIILESEKSPDIGHVLTKIYPKLKFKHVYYSNKNDSISKLALEQSFVGVKFYSVSSEEISLESTSFTFSDDSRCVHINTCAGKVSVFSYYGYQNSAYSKADAFDARLIIAGDYGDSINYIYKPREIISYQKGSCLRDAESQGLVRVLL